MSSFYSNGWTCSQTHRLAAAKVTAKSASGVTLQTYMGPNRCAVFSHSNLSSQNAKLWLPPKSPKSVWYSIRNCLYQLYKFICAFQVSETKKGIISYFDKNVLKYFIALVFIALYEYRIESPSIQFTCRNYTFKHCVTKAVNTLHSTKSTLQKFKN